MDPELSSRFFARPEVAEHEFDTLGREHVAGGCSDASSGSRDDRDSAVERSHDVVVRLIVS